MRRIPINRKRIRQIRFNEIVAREISSQEYIHVTVANVICDAIIISFSLGLVPILIIFVLIIWPV